MKHSYCTQKKTIAMNGYNLYKALLKKYLLHYVVKTGHLAFSLNTLIYYFIFSIPNVGEP